MCERVQASRLLVLPVPNILSASNDILRANRRARID